MDEGLNLDKIENKILNNNGKEKNLNKKISCPIIMDDLPLNEINEKIDNKEIYVDIDPQTSPYGKNVKNQKRKIAYSTKMGDLFGLPKQKTGLFIEESKSDDEDNINDKKLDVLEEEENEGRKSIYTKYNEADILDNEDYIKKLEEKWKYEKILLDYNIIDFTSK